MAAFKNYDRDTGQIFRYWNVPVPGVMHRPWNRDTTRWGRSTADINQLCRRGPPTLVDICLKLVVDNIEHLDKAHLQYIPSPLMGKIIEGVKDTGGVSVETWKLLIRITQDEEMARYVSPHLMRHEVQVEKTQPLSAYIEPLVSSTFDFLTHLTITGAVRCAPPELLQLVQLKTLAVLEIVQLPDDGSDGWTPVRLTDSIVREWSTSPDPFPVLRVLRIWGEDQTTAHSLRYITAFPSLVFYDIAGRRQDWVNSSRQPGWKCKGSRTWTQYQRDTLSRHFSFLPKGVPVAQPKSSSSAVVTKIDDVLDAIFEDDSTELLPIQRSNHNTHVEMSNKPGNHSFLLCLRWSHLESLIASNFWGFLMYCQIGTLSLDRDLLSQGLDIGERAFALKSLVLPPRPMLNLILTELAEDPEIRGSRGGAIDRDFCYYRLDPHFELHSEVFGIQLTFVRDRCHHEEREVSKSSAAAEGKAAKRPPETSTTTRRPTKRRQGVSDILASFNSG
ncbi:hypothetical protein F4825DRAFT_14335 [Nemania diffusa]|nr:hypothetical protein F4825DRAFT_14335 [Nemania diffusa]